MPYSYNQLALFIPLSVGHLYVSLNPLYPMKIWHWQGAVSFWGGFCQKRLKKLQVFIYYVQVPSKMWIRFPSQGPILSLRPLVSFQLGLKQESLHQTPHGWAKIVTLPSSRSTFPRKRTKERRRGRGEKDMFSKNYVWFLPQMMNVMQHQGMSHPHL